MDKYEEFRKILDSDAAGAPASPAFNEILKILFTEEDIDLLCEAIQFQMSEIGGINEL